MYIEALEIEKTVFMYITFAVVVAILAMAYVKGKK